MFIHVCCVGEKKGFRGIPVVDDVFANPAELVEEGYLAADSCFGRHICNEPLSEVDAIFPHDANVAKACAGSDSAFHEGVEEGIAPGGLAEFLELFVCQGNSVEVVSCTPGFSFQD